MSRMVERGGGRRGGAGGGAPPLRPPPRRPPRRCVRVRSCPPAVPNISALSSATETARASASDLGAATINASASRMTVARRIFLHRQAAVTSP